MKGEGNESPFHQVCYKHTIIIYIDRTLECILQSHPNVLRMLDRPSPP